MGYESDTDTTTEDLNFFRSEITKLVNFFQLRNFRWSAEVDDTGEQIAQSDIGYDTHTIAIDLTSENLPDDDNQRIQMLRETAMHEVVEAGLLGTLIIFARDNRGISNETIEAESHAIVHKLMWIFKQYNKKIAALKAEIKRLKGG